MLPEQVPAEMVEKAYRARADYMRGEPIGDLEWQAVWSTIEADGMRHALAAVLPAIQAQALREVADVVKRYTGRLESADGADEVVSLVESVIRQRAARLTTTTDRTTT